jgi:peptidoglycan/xylan/chitin deacetylase (PgdA/CDA1 family)
MRNGLKNALYFLLYQLRTVADVFFNFQEVSVLCYHSVDNDEGELTMSPSAFDRQLSYLKNHGHYFATLDEIVAYAKGEKKLPRKCVALTFDDGYEDILTQALPILTKYRAPATLFVIEDFETHKKLFKPGAPMLSDASLAKLTESGLVTLGHHSISHAMLETLDDAELARELANERRYAYFAYPGGHYSKRVMKAVEGAGFKAAFTIKPGLIASGDELFALKRNVILSSMPMWQFALRTTAAIAWYRKIIKFHF